MSILEGKGGGEGGRGKEQEFPTMFAKRMAVAACALGQGGHQY